MGHNVIEIETTVYVFQATRLDIIAQTMGVKGEIPKSEK